MNNKLVGADYFEWLLHVERQEKLRLQQMILTIQQNEFNSKLEQERISESEVLKRFKDTYNIDLSRGDTIDPITGEITRKLESAKEVS